MISNASRLSDTVRLPAEDGAAGLHEPKLGRDPPRRGVVLVAGPRDRRLARGGNQNQRWHGVAVRPGPATDIAVPPGLLIFVVNLLEGGIATKSEALCAPGDLLEPRAGVSG